MSLTISQQLDVLAAHYALHGPPEKDEWDGFVQTARANEAAERLQRRFAALNALPLARQLTLTLSRLSNAAPPDSFLAALTEDGTVVRWQGEPVGERRAFVRAVLPQEAQIRLAYENLLMQFLDHLQGQQRIVPLGDNGVMVELFVPAGAEADLDVAWAAFIPTAFSWEALERSFLLLVNSLKLTERGFGYVNFPPVTPHAARMQAAFYLAALHERLVYGHKGFKAADKKFRETRQKLSEQREALKIGGASVTGWSLTRSSGRGRSRGSRA